MKRQMISPAAKAAFGSAEDTDGSGMQLLVNRACLAFNLVYINTQKRRVIHSTFRSLHYRLMELLMKLIHNELEYRDWMIKNVLLTDDDIYCIFSPDEQEEQLLIHMPEQFPCIAILIPGKDHREPVKPWFLYRSQIEEWANLFGPATRPQ